MVDKKENKGKKEQIVGGVGHLPHSFAHPSARSSSSTRYSARPSSARPSSARGNPESTLFSALATPQVPVNRYLSSHVSNLPMFPTSPPKVPINQQTKGRRYAWTENEVQLPQVNNNDLTKQVSDLQDFLDAKKSEVGYLKKYLNVQLPNDNDYDEQISDLQDILDSKKREVGYLNDFLNAKIYVKKQNGETTILTVTDLLFGESNLQSHNLYLEDEYEDEKSNIAGGAGKREALIQEIYNQDIKLVKYDQMIAYKVYKLHAIYKDEYNLQQGGAWYHRVGKDLVHIHEKFAGFPLSEKLTALQSLAKELLVYLYKKAMKKLKVPDNIIDISLSQTSEDFYYNVIKTLNETISPESVFKAKINIIRNSKFDEDQKRRKMKLLNIEIIDSISTFANLINVFSSTLALTPDDSTKALESLNSLVEGLEKMKEHLKREQTNKATIMQSTKEYLTEFINNINPKLSSAKELTDYNKRQSEINKVLHAVTAIEGFKKHTNYENHPHLYQYIESHQETIKKANLALEDLELKVNESIETSRQLLVLLCVKLGETLKTELTHKIKETFLNNPTVRDLHEQIQDNSFLSKNLKNIQHATREIVNDAQAPLQSLTKTLSSQAFHVLRLVAPFAVNLAEFVQIAVQVSFVLTIINLCIVGMHYLIRTTIFFWKRYNNKNDNKFDIDGFISELKSRHKELEKKPDSKHKGGKRKTKQQVLKGGVTLPPINRAVPFVEGSKIPLLPRIHQEINSKTLSTQGQITFAIMDHIVNYGEQDTINYQLSKEDVVYIATGAENLSYTNNTFDIDKIYHDTLENTQYGGKVKRLTKQKERKYLEEKTKKDLILYAKHKGVNVRVNDKKDDIVKAILSGKRTKQQSK